MDHFTPYAAIAGGLLIGLAAAALLLVNGKVAGISGIVEGAVTAQTGRGWRVAFLAGLLLSLPLLQALGVATPVIAATAEPAATVAAGLLVGFGTRLGSGCTSGHGVCGIGRGSLRSLTATATFMATAALTIFVVRHVIGV